jgi:hexokinase
MMCLREVRFIDENQINLNNPMKIYLEGKFVTCMRSCEVTISDDDIQELRSFMPCPYKGKTPKAFMEYLPKLMKALMKNWDSAPAVSKELYGHLFSKDDLPVFSEAWSERDKPIHTVLMIKDSRGTVMAKAGSRRLHI